MKKLLKPKKNIPPYYRVRLPVKPIDNVPLFKSESKEQEMEETVEPTQIIITGFATQVDLCFGHIRCKMNLIEAEALKLDLEKAIERVRLYNLSVI